MGGSLALSADAPGLCKPSRVRLRPAPWNTTESRSSLLVGVGEDASIVARNDRTTERRKPRVSRAFVT